MSISAGSRAQAPLIPDLSANDVSWLFPVPTQAADFDNLIPIGSLTTANPNDPTKRDAVWTAAAFQSFVDIATSPAAQVGGNAIHLPPEARSIDAWFVAGIRIDAGAPGLSPDIVAQFGQSPQIRIVVQPVIRNPDGTPAVQDIAGHLVFDFVNAASDPAQAGCLARPVPDLVALKAMVTEIAALRTKLSAGQLGADNVTTSGVPLGVHPGLLDATTARNVSAEMKSFLERHAFARNLDAMAIAGPAPWIFLAMQKLPSGGFVPVPSPTLDGQQVSQMLNVAGSDPRVTPVANTNNGNAITCRNEAASRRGVSTAGLFANPPSADQAKEILDLISDPARSHFFNTDCVSCHTETRRAMQLLQVTTDPRIDSAVLPGDDWNVRNFGWSPFGARQPQATVTRRTAAETDAVVKFINSELLNK
jgi:hypothetical protein